MKKTVKQALLALIVLVMSMGYSFAQGCTPTDKIQNGTFANANNWNISGTGWVFAPSRMFGNGNLSSPIGTPISSTLSQTLATPLAPGNHRLKFSFGTQDMSTFISPTHRTASLEIKLGGVYVATITNTNSGGTGLSNDNITVSTATGVTTNFNLTTTNLTIWQYQNDLYFDIPVLTVASDIEFVFNTTGDYMQMSNVSIETCGPLPVKLISFTAEQMGKDVLLNWETAAETGNSHFEVQESADAVNFSYLGTVSGHGTTTTEQKYSYLHKNPVSGITYYRLRQVDYDGSYEYFIIRSIDVKGNNGEVFIYPNPATSHVVLSNVALGTSYQVLDTQGRVLVSTRTADQGSIVLDTSTLPQGTHLIRFTKDGKTETKRFVVNK